ncbi:hypothetical protein CAEBREN_31447 [Caenorhabditis brenneri]|uniref:BTB domain-containing protein n=1 Tax=Caenorhabditis brenneri TaxID=135651 RepID=G0MVX6_CAEBE|nr:hypothetical protein CAEBREN_31447 [Caenorhabditis brenneri]
MPEASEPSIYEKTFAKTDETDAILVVDGKKLHVNKVLLSIHSNFFKTLFNSEFKEKSMEEIEIKDVKFEDFATLLSLIHPDPLLPDEYKAEKLLELADRFLLPAAKRHLELFICSTQMDAFKKLKIADKYDFDALRNSAVASLTSQTDFEEIYDKSYDFSDSTKSKLFVRFIYLMRSRQLVP